jgi:hypothetical protein
MEADYNVLTFEQQMRYNLMTGVCASESDRLCIY